MFTITVVWYNADGSELDRDTCGFRGFRDRDHAISYWRRYWLAEPGFIHTKPGCDPDVGYFSAPCDPSAE